MLSQDLRRYYAPELSRAVIDIPSYVSNGYLVFSPDLDVEYKGYAGEIALNSVLGAADKLVQMPFVDSTKMAIHGHSWGGYECNFMVAHTNRFAAALSGSGAADHIGAYGLPTHGGMPRWSMSYDESWWYIDGKAGCFYKELS